MRKPEWHTVLGASTWDGIHVLKYNIDDTNYGRQTYDFGYDHYVTRRELRNVGNGKWKYVVVGKRKPREGDVFVMFCQEFRIFEIMEKSYFDWYMRKVAADEEKVKIINEEYRRVTGHD